MSQTTDPVLDPVTGRPVRQERQPARETVDEVAPGVGRIQIPISIPGLGHVNCYVLEDERGVTLIDPGLPDPDSHADLMRKLDSIGVRPERIHSVLVTHSHPDHFGGAGRLRVEHHSEVIAHRSFSTPFDRPPDDDLGELDDNLVPEMPEGLEGPVNERLLTVLFGDGPVPEFRTRQMPWGGDGFRPGAGEAEHMRSWDDLTKRGLLSLTPTKRVDDQEYLRMGRRDWQVVHTPGHTGDHICLLDPENGILLSGDHVLPTITPHISGLTPSPDSLAEFVEGLRKVAAIPDVKLVLPAHGLPFTDLTGRTDAIIEHHNERLQLTMDIGRELGLATVAQYSQKLFQERSWGPMAESEAYAHLEHLRMIGDMDGRMGEDGLLRFRVSETAEIA